MAARTAAAAGDKRGPAAAGLPPVGDLHAATADAPPLPPPPPHPGGLGELDLVGLLTNPFLGHGLVLQYLGNDTAAASALRGTCRGARDAVAAYPWADKRTVVRRPSR